MTVTLERPPFVHAYLAPTRETPGAARHHGHDWLVSLGAPAADIDTVDLLLSELVTNAVIHGAGRVEVRLNTNGTGYELEVIDQGSKAISATRPSGHGDECGRGWEIVEALTGRPPTVIHDQAGTRVSTVIAYGLFGEAA